MVNTPTPKELSSVAGISGSYACQILGGKRPTPPHVALSAFRHFGIRLGFLAEMSDADIDRLCAERGAEVSHSSKADRESDAAQAANEVNADLSAAAGTAQ